MLYKGFNDIYFGNKNILVSLCNLNFEKNELENNCFDCGSRNPELISINNGILICKACGINHMTFPPGTSILIDKEKGFLSEKDLQFLKYGGNKRLHEFILEQCPSLINLPKIILYTSPLINLYRKRLFTLVNMGYKINKDVNKVNNFKNNLSNLQIDDDNNTHFSTNRTDNNKNISSINNINFVTEETKNYNTNTILKKSNIIYNRPKLKKAINKLKIGKKENNDIANTTRNNIYKKIFSLYFDNNNLPTNKTNNNYIHLRNSFPIKNFYLPSNENRERKYSSNTINPNEKRELFMSESKKGRIHNSEIPGNFKTSTIKKEKKIKEIIINKNLNTYDSISNNLYKFNTKTYLDQRRPIQVNLSLQNTMDNSQNNNIYKSTICHTDLDFNETPTIIIHNTQKSTKSVKKLERKISHSINNIHINLNNNLKKKKEENTKIVRNMSENKIKTININFIKNKKNKTINTQENINKNINLLTTDEHIKINENYNINKEYSFTTNNKLIKEESVFQFQILPNKIFKKINPKNIRNKKLNILNKENIINNKKENSKLSKNINIKSNNNNYIIKRKIISPKKNEINSENYSGNNSKNELSELKESKNNFLFNSYKKLNQFKIVEPFKNSIRNKYKREKSKQKK